MSQFSYSKGATVIFNGLSIKTATQTVRMYLQTYYSLIQLWRIEKIIRHSLWFVFHSTNRLADNDVLWLTRKLHDLYLSADMFFRFDMLACCICVQHYNLKVEFSVRVFIHRCTTFPPKRFKPLRNLQKARLWRKHFFISTLHMAPCYVPVEFRVLYEEGFVV